MDVVIAVAYSDTALIGLHGHKVKRGRLFQGTSLYYEIIMLKSTRD